MNCHITLVVALAVSSVLADYPRHAVRLAQRDPSYRNTTSGSSTSVVTSTLNYYDNDLTSDSPTSTLEYDYNVLTIAPPAPTSGIDYDVLTIVPLSGRVRSECIPNSTVTYTGYVYPTVYVTINGSYEVPTTASNNASLVDAPTLLVTPLEACSTLILGNLNLNPLKTPVSFATFKLSSVNPDNLSASDSPLPSQILNPSRSMDPKRTTSTVIVTKKTPVPAGQVPTNANPPVTFERPIPTEVVTPAGSTPPVPTRQSDSGPDQGGHSDDNGNSNNGPINNNGSNNGNNKGGGNNNNDSGVPRQSSQTPIQVDSPNTTQQPLPRISSELSGLGQIINSIINSPFGVPILTKPATTQQAAVDPTEATIAGVTVSIDAPNIVIAGTTIAIPTGTQAPATIVVNSQTFTIQKNQIAAADTTYSLVTAATGNNLVLAPVMSTITQSPSAITVGSVTFTVGISQAVISGTTYRIGSGATPTTIVVGGQTVSLGANGVAFSSKTYAPAVTIVGEKYELVTVDGLILSVDASEAIISGTTFRIGSGAPLSTATVGTNTITLASNGVVFRSTTIHPTSISVPLTTTKSQSGSPTGSSGGSANTSTASKTAAGHRNSASSPETAGLSSLFSFLLGLLSIVRVLL